MAGVPPSAGFVGKLELFRTGIVADSVTGRAALVVLLVAGSARSLVYMSQVYQRRFWRTDPPAVDVVSPLPQRLLTAVLALLVLGTGLWPEPLLALSSHAADILLAGAPG